MPIQLQRLFPIPTFGGEARENSLFGQRTIETGAGDDLIRISKRDDGLYEISINGQTETYTKDQLRNLTIDAGSGNDRIIVDEGVDVRPTIKGGTGDDYISVHAGGVSVDAGEGNDLIVNEGSSNVINAGAGNDTIYSRGWFNAIDGGSGRDSITSVGAYNHISGGDDGDSVVSHGNYNGVYGGRGEDSVRVDGNYNAVDGGADPDVLTVTGGRNDIIVDHDDELNASGFGNRINVSKGRRNILGNVREDHRLAADNQASELEGSSLRKYEA